MRPFSVSIAAGLLLIAGFAGAALPTDDKGIVSGLDAEYQAAVRTHDAARMSRILSEDFVLVNGRGRIFSKADLLMEARDSGVIYRHQEDTSRTVRLWENTAVVTALLWAKGTDKGKPFDYKLWFSDTYVRTPSGWRYVFGQSSLPLPNAP
jgi:ketosteroid isomerase-like protein